MSKKFALLFVALVLTLGSSFMFAGDKLKPEELIAKHLESIGTPEARAAVKTRVLKGDFSYTQQVGSPGIGADVHAHAKAAKGQAQLISAGRAINYLLISEEPGYQGERIYYNTKRPMIAMQGQQSRSLMGDFLEREDFVIQEGIFGGTLGTNWALLDVAARQPKLISGGTKKINGKEVYVLEYMPKKRDTNLTIKMYFEKDTFRHVRTMYEWKEAYQATSAGGSADAGRPRRAMTLQEDFGKFETVDGVTVPQTWDIQYGQEPVPGVVEFNVVLKEAVQNVDAAPQQLFPYE